ncbi:HAMP domain-containing protein [Sporolactobacillus sp. THM7-4]|nr:HAMP domain-containing protein [Sporolactobacillus sp. THM7-4]
MIWKSIIGKLWATIIALVTIVLLFLTVLLLQFFENNNIQQVEHQMEKIGGKAAYMLQSSGDQKAALSAVSEIANVYDSGSAVVSRDHFWLSPSGYNHLPKLDRRFFESNPILKKALSGNQIVKTQGSFPVNRDGRHVQEKMIIVGVPARTADGRGAVYVFQSLRIIQNTMDQSKKLISISAGIAIILTTFFAFFLSTRIGAPLRRMRTAAIQVAHGNFDINVPVVTRDEVGELAVAFNKMRKKLKENMTALSQEKEQLSGILENMADGVLMLDEQGNIRASNPPANRFVRSWHFENDDNPSRSVNHTPDLLIDLFEKVAKQESPQIQETGVQGRFWVIIMTPLYDRRKVRGAVAVLRDMTEERHIDELKKGFIANVSHELRTPIAMMQGYSEAIIDDIAQTDQEKKDMAQIILDESKRMGRLVNELLDLARMEAGHFQLEKKDIPLVDFFEHAVYKFSKLAKESGIALSMDTDIRKDERFELDPDRIEQVMTNLIDNAIRHTRKGGSVSVGVYHVNQQIRVSVRDTGTGISPKDLPFVFERFYKEDKARTRGKSGTGLGLSIARHIVEAHGGEISVNSKKGQGTTFLFTLPDAAGK